MLCNDWEKMMPNVSKYVDLEAKRAVKLQLIGDEEELVTYFKNIMNDGCKEIMDIVARYFYLPGLRLGWSILQVVDPTVGRINCRRGNTMRPKKVKVNKLRSTNKG